MVGVYSEENQISSRRKFLQLALKGLIEEKFQLKHNEPASLKQFMTMYQRAKYILDQWNVTTEEILMELTLNKLDGEIRERFEDQICLMNKTPTFDQLDSFMEKEIRILGSTTKDE
ncbi:hypothetical protein ACFFRR_010407 [Megaselia abdita]